MFLKFLSTFRRGSSSFVGRNTSYLLIELIKGRVELYILFIILQIDYFKSRGLGLLLLNLSLQLMVLEYISSLLLIDTSLEPAKLKEEYNLEGS
jgi:hypothetical protein